MTVFMTVFKMTVFTTRSLAFATFLAALPIGFAQGAGTGSGAAGSGAGAGALAAGSAPLAWEAQPLAAALPRVELEEATGRRSRRRRAGVDQSRWQWRCWDGDPALNAAGVRTVPADNPASGLENAPTTNGVIGGDTGVPPSTGAGAVPPPIAGQAQPAPVTPKGVEGAAQPSPSSTVGRAVLGPDGISTKIVAPKPCSTAARETDGTTTCVGIPSDKRRAR